MQKAQVSTADLIAPKDLYSIHKADIEAAVCFGILKPYAHMLQGGLGLIPYHNHSHIDAVIDLFPEHKLERERFSGIPGKSSVVKCII